MYDIIIAGQMLLSAADQFRNPFDPARVYYILQ